MNYKCSLEKDGMNVVQFFYLKFSLESVFFFFQGKLCKTNFILDEYRTFFSFKN